MSGIRFGSRALKKLEDSIHKYNFFDLKTNSTSYNTWTRPSDWPSVSNISNNRFHGLIAVLNDNDNNLVALRATVAGGYTVDWGDGTVTNYANNTAAEYQYIYSNVSSNITSEGFKTSIVQVYAQNTSNNFTDFTLFQKHSSITSASVNPIVPWLEIKFSFPSITTFNDRIATANSVPIARFTYLKNIEASLPALTSMSYTFAKLHSAERVIVNTTGSFTSSFFAFAESYKLREVSISNTDNLTSTTGMFSSCTALKDAPMFNTAKVTDARSMFDFAYNLVNVPEYNLSNLQNARTMFNFAVALESVPQFNTAKLTDAGQMFSQCTKLKYVPPMDFSNVTIANNAFGATAIETIPLLKPPATNSNINAMFSACRALTEINSFHCNANIATSVFQSCASLKKAINISLPMATNVQSLFSSCSALEVVDIKDISNATSAVTMFQSCFLLREVNINQNTSKLTNCVSMFESCRELGRVPMFNTSNVTNMASMFSSTYRLESNGLPLFDTSNVSNMASMFNSARSIETIPTFNTAKVTNMSSMFSTARSLTEIPLIDTSNVTNMSNMFYDTRKLRTLPLLNTSKVSNMRQIFQFCRSLDNIPNINTSNVTDFSQAFVSMFITYAPNIDTSNVTDLSLLFNDTNIAVIPNWNVRNATGLGLVGTSNGCLQSIQLTGARVSFSVANNALSASALNNLYTSLAGLGNTSVNNAVGDGSNVVYTTSANHVYIVGQNITVTGLTPAGYNVTNANIIAITNDTFTVANTTTGTSSGTGTANGGSNSRVITVTNNWGTTTDDTTIATNKNWTVSG